MWERTDSENLFKDESLKSASSTATFSGEFRQKLEQVLWATFEGYKRRIWSISVGMGLLLLACVVLVFVFRELETSSFQARYFARISGEITYSVEDGPNPEIWFPTVGPHNDRLGYTRLRHVLDALTFKGYEIQAQARASSTFHSVIERGGFPIYHEKTRAGLVILDRERRQLYGNPSPEHIYPDFHSIPPLIVETLLFIENRTLLDASNPNKNPAFEWKRLGRAVMDKTATLAGSDRSVPGASTLAVQMEKLRHSPEGRTESPREKLRQMYSASLRSYLDGEDTMAARRRIVVDYLNSLPLAGIPPYGEVVSLGDGLWAWYGVDFDEVNELLAAFPGTGGGQIEQAIAYRQVLSLFIAHRRPSFYLAQPEGREVLAELTDEYLRMLATERIISDELQEAATGLRVAVRTRAPERVAGSFTERKSANAIRTELLKLLDAPQLYDLDKFDLRVQSTYDEPTQRAVTEVLTSLRDREYVRTHGLEAFRLLAQGDPTKVNYAIVLYERTDRGNVVRIQTDNFDGPFNVNQQSKLELGSTAKLRALVNYLQIIEEIFNRYRDFPVAELQKLHVNRDDRLTAWTVAYLVRQPNATRQQILAAAMERGYSANPSERFFTGGGMHTFRNFDATHNAQVVSVNTAFRHSINLPFIRMMRDIVNYEIGQLPDNPALVIEDVRDPRRSEYLSRFADREGRQFMDRFYGRYRGLAPEAMPGAIVSGRGLTLQRMAWTFRAVQPEVGLEEFRDFVSEHVAAPVAEGRLADAFRRADPEGHSWQDLGYLASIHPLELWTAKYMMDHPKAERSEVLDAAYDVRQEAYQWLFASRNRSAQNTRIRTLLEEDAFHAIHYRWEQVGYPFERLVPSYATSIGTSADRPGALAELVGIVLNDGIRYPVVQITGLQFAEGTPYETIMTHRPEEGERVLSPEVAATVRKALADVVEHGTARRAHRSVRAADGQPLVIGGKTGTGDNRIQVFGAAGKVVESRSINRTSTFVFFIGDRFFGTVTTYVDGPEAARYGFTSSLPAQILKMIGPEIEPLMTDLPDNGGIRLASTSQ